MPPLGFATKNCLFFGEWLSSKTFFRRWVDVFWTLAKKLQQTVKIVFLSVQRNIFKRKFFPEKNSFIKFQTSSGVFFKKNLVKGISFWQKIISTVVKTGLYASRGTFWGKICFPKKKSIKKIVFYFERNFSFLYRTCLACLSKTFHRLQMKVLRKVIFSNKKFFTDFFQNLRGKVSYFGNESFIVNQMCVSLV